MTHSHGGNVALYALRDPEARARVEGLVCLAVPFLDIHVAPFRRDVLFFSVAAVALLAFDVGSWMLGGYAILYGALAGWILTSGNLGDSDESLKRIVARQARVRLPDELPTADGSATPVLVLTIPGDEVSWLMKLGRFVGHHCRLAWDLLNRFGVWILGGLMAFSLGRLLAEEIGRDVGRVQSVASWLDQNVVMPLLATASVVLMVIVVMRWCFAFDGARWIATFDVRTDETPPLPHQPEKVPGLPGCWLRHTDIQRRAVGQIARWVARGQARDLSLDPAG